MDEDPNKQPMPDDLANLFGDQTDLNINWFERSPESSTPPSQQSTQQANIDNTHFSSFFHSQSSTYPMSHDQIQQMHSDRSNNVISQNYQTGKFPVENALSPLCGRSQTSPIGQCFSLPPNQHSPPIEQIFVPNLNSPPNNQQQSSENYAFSTSNFAALCQTNLTTQTSNQVRLLTRHNSTPEYCQQPVQVNQQGYQSLPSTPMHVANNQQRGSRMKSPYQIPFSTVNSQNSPSTPVSQPNFGPPQGSSQCLYTSSSISVHQVRTPPAQNAPCQVWSAGVCLNGPVENLSAANPSQNVYPIGVVGNLSAIDQMYPISPVGSLPTADVDYQAAMFSPMQPSSSFNSHSQGYRLDSDGQLLCSSTYNPNQQVYPISPMESSPTFNPNQQYGSISPMDNYSTFSSTSLPEMLCEYCQSYNLYKERHSQQFVVLENQQRSPPQVGPVRERQKRGRPLGSTKKNKANIESLVNVFSLFNQAQLSQLAELLRSGNRSHELNAFFLANMSDADRRDLAELFCKDHVSEQYIAYYINEMKPLNRKDFADLLVSPINEDKLKEVFRKHKNRKATKKCQDRKKKTVEELEEEKEAEKKRKESLEIEMAITQSQLDQLKEKFDQMCVCRHRKHQ